MKQKSRRSEVPQDIKEYIEFLKTQPLSSVGEALRQYQWKGDKGDLWLWSGLLTHFEEYIKSVVKNRQELTLKFGQTYQYQEWDQTITDNCRGICLSVQVLFDNCVNKQASVELVQQLKAFLSCPDQQVISDILDVFVAYVRRAATQAPRHTGLESVAPYLEVLALNPSGSAVVDMMSCVSEGGLSSDMVANACSIKTTFYCDVDLSTIFPNTAMRPLVVNLPNVAAINGQDMYKTLFQLLQQTSDWPCPMSFIGRYKLLGMIRRALAMATLESRRNMILNKLKALYVLSVQSSRHSQVMTYVVHSEPDFILDLVNLIKAHDTLPQDVCCAAMRVLTVQLSDRSRSLGVLGAFETCGGAGGLLTVLLHRTVQTLMPTDGVSAGYSYAFMDALLQLVYALVNIPQGSGTVPASVLFPVSVQLLQTTSPEHVGLSNMAVRILEVYLENNDNLGNTSVQNFRETGGAHALVARLSQEVQSGVMLVNDSMAVDNTMHIDASSSQHSTAPIRDPTTQDDQVPSVGAGRKLLIKNILRIVTLISQYPPQGSSSNGLDASDAQTLYCALRDIFDNGKTFGGMVVSMAGNTMDDMLHNDPHCFRGMNEVGLPMAYINSTKDNPLVNTDVVSSIPTNLVSLCINKQGLQYVHDNKALKWLIPLFTSPEYYRLHNMDVSVMIGQGLEELFRHQPSTRKQGIEMIVEILKKYVEVGGLDQEWYAQAKAGWDKDATASSQTETMTDQQTSTDGGAAQAEQTRDQGQQTGQQDEATVMDTDIVQEQSNTNEQTAKVEASSSKDPTGTSNTAAKESEHPLHAYLPEQIQAVSKLLDNILSNADVAREFVAAGGHQYLLQILHLTNTNAAFGSSQYIHPVPMCIRLLSQADADRIGKDLTTSLKPDLKQLIKRAQEIGSACVPEMEAEERNKYVRLVASIDAQIGITGHVCRNTPAVFKQLCNGDEPLMQLVSEALQWISWQFIHADQWKVKADAAKAAAAAAAKAAQQNSADAAQAGAQSAAAGPSTSKADQSGATAMEQDDNQAVQASAEWAPARQDEAVPADPTDDTNVDRVLQSEILDDELLDDSLPRRGSRLVSDVARERMRRRSRPATQAFASAVGMAAGISGHSSGQSLSVAQRQSKGRNPDELAYAVLEHSTVMIRSMYVAIAKSVHSPARRSLDAWTPNPDMLVACSAIGLAFVEFLQGNPVGSSSMGGALEASGSGAASEGAGKQVAGGAQASYGNMQRGVMHDTRKKVKYIRKIVDLLDNTLFDNRRRVCHGLVVNYFAQLGGLDQIKRMFQFMLPDLKAVAIIHTQAANSSTSMQIGSSSEDSVDEDVEQIKAKLLALDETERAGVKKALESALLLLLAVLESLSQFHRKGQFSNGHMLKLLEFNLPLSSAEKQDKNGQDKFISKLQAGIYNAVLPLWETGPYLASFPDLQSNLLTLLSSTRQAALISQAETSQKSSQEKSKPSVNPVTQQSLIEMGYTQAQIEQAVTSMGASRAVDVGACIDWLASHADEPAANNAAQPSQQAPSTPMTRAVTKTAIQSNWNKQISSESGGRTDVLEIVQRGIEVVRVQPSAASSMANMVRYNIKSKREALGDKSDNVEAAFAPLKELVNVLKEADIKDMDRVRAAAHLLLVTIYNKREERIYTAQQDLADAVLNLLEQWAENADNGKGCITVPQSTAGTGTSADTSELVALPDWIDPLLLLLVTVCKTQPTDKSKTDSQTSAAPAQGQRSYFAGPSGTRPGGWRSATSGRRQELDELGSEVYDLMDRRIYEASGRTIEEWTSSALPVARQDEGTAAPAIPDWQVPVQDRELLDTYTAQLAAQAPAILSSMQNTIKDLLHTTNSKLFVSSDTLRQWSEEPIKDIAMKIGSHTAPQVLSYTVQLLVDELKADVSSMSTQLENVGTEVTMSKWKEVLDLLEKSATKRCGQLLQYVHRILQHHDVIEHHPIAQSLSQKTIDITKDWNEALKQKRQKLNAMASSSDTNAVQQSVGHIKDMVALCEKGKFLAARCCLELCAVKVPEIDQSLSKFERELQVVLSSWGQCGLLSYRQQERASKVCLAVLRCVLQNRSQILSSRRKMMLNQKSQQPEQFLKLPDVDSTISATLSLLHRVTLNNTVAQQVLDNDGLTLLFGLPASSLCYNAQQVSECILHMVEDPTQLQHVFEGSIRSQIHGKEGRSVGDTVSYPLRDLCIALAHCIYRDPQVFLKALNNICQLKDPTSGTEVILKKKNVEEKEGDKEVKGHGENKDKEKSSKEKDGDKSKKEKDREKNKAKEKRVKSVQEDVEMRDHTQQPETPAKKDKGSKHAKKWVPERFVQVVDFLLQQLLSYTVSTGPIDMDDDDVVCSENCIDLSGFQDNVEIKQVIDQHLKRYESRSGSMQGYTQEYDEENKQLKFKVFVANRVEQQQMLALDTLHHLCLHYPAGTLVLLRRDIDPKCGDPIPFKLPAHFKNEQPVSSIVLKHIFMQHNVLQRKFSQAMQIHVSDVLYALALKSHEGRRRVLQLAKERLTWDIDETNAKVLSQGIDDDSSLFYDRLAAFQNVEGLPHTREIVAAIELCHLLLFGKFSFVQQGRNANTRQSYQQVLEVVRTMWAQGIPAALIKCFNLVILEHPRASTTVLKLLTPLEVLTKNRPTTMSRKQQSGQATRAEESSQATERMEVQVGGADDGGMQRQGQGTDDMDMDIANDGQQTQQNDVANIAMSYLLDIMAMQDFPHNETDMQEQGDVDGEIIVQHGPQGGSIGLIEHNTGGMIQFQTTPHDAHDVPLVGDEDDDDVDDMDDMQHTSSGSGSSEGDGFESYDGEHDEHNERVDIDGDDGEHGDDVGDVEDDEEDEDDTSDDEPMEYAEGVEGVEQPVALDEHVVGGEGDMVDLEHDEEERESEEDDDEDDDEDSAASYEQDIYSDADVGIDSDNMVNGANIQLISDTFDAIGNPGWDAPSSMARPQRDVWIDDTEQFGPHEILHSLLRDLLNGSDMPREAGGQSRMNMGAPSRWGNTLGGSSSSVAEQIWQRVQQSINGGAPGAGMCITNRGGRGGPMNVMPNVPGGPAGSEHRLLVTQDDWAAGRAGMANTGGMAAPRRSGWQESMHTDGGGRHEYNFFDVGRYMVGDDPTGVRQVWLRNFPMNRGLHGPHGRRMRMDIVGDGLENGTYGGAYNVTDNNRDTIGRLPEATQWLSNTRDRVEGSALELMRPGLSSNVGSSARSRMDYRNVAVPSVFDFIQSVPLRQATPAQPARSMELETSNVEQNQEQAQSSGASSVMQSYVDGLRTVLNQIPSAQAGGAEGEGGEGGTDDMDTAPQQDAVRDVGSVIARLLESGNEQSVMLPQQLLDVLINSIQTGAGTGEINLEAGGAAEQQADGGTEQVCVDVQMDEEGGAEGRDSEGDGMEVGDLQQDTAAPAAAAATEAPEQAGAQQLQGTAPQMQEDAAATSLPSDTHQQLDQTPQPTAGTGVTAQAPAADDQMTDQVAGTSAEASDDQMEVDAQQPAETPAQQPTQTGENTGTDAPAPEGALDSVARTAAESLGIDVTFLQALPEELRQEVLAQHQSSSGIPIVPVAAHPAPVHSQEVPPIEPVAAQPAAVEPESGTAESLVPEAVPADAAAAAVQPTEAPSAGDAGAGEAATNEAGHDLQGLDPEFLAALPPELRAEVIQQHNAEQRTLQQEREMAQTLSSTADEPDFATLLASFPPEIREDVLLSQEPQILQRFTPSMLAEAQLLREGRRGGAVREPRTVLIDTVGREADMFVRRRLRDESEFPPLHVIDRHHYRPIGPLAPRKPIKWQGIDPKAGAQADQQPILDDQALRTLVLLLKASSTFDSQTNMPINRVIANIAQHQGSANYILSCLLSYYYVSPAKRDAFIARLKSREAGSGMEVDSVWKSDDGGRPSGDGGAQTSTENQDTLERNVVGRFLQLLHCVVHTAGSKLPMTIATMSVSQDTYWKHIATRHLGQLGQVPTDKSGTKGKQSNLSQEHSVKGLEVLLTLVVHPTVQRSLSLLTEVLVLIENVLKYMVRQSTRSLGARYQRGTLADYVRGRHPYDSFYDGLTSRRDGAGNSGVQASREQATRATDAATGQENADNQQRQQQQTQRDGSGSSADAPGAPQQPAEAESRGDEQQKTGANGKQDSAQKKEGASSSSSENEVNTVLNSLPVPLVRGVASLLACHGYSTKCYQHLSSLLQHLTSAAPQFKAEVGLELAASTQRLAEESQRHLQQLVDNGLDLSSMQVAQTGQYGTVMLRVTRCMMTILPAAPQADEDKGQNDAGSNGNTRDTAQAQGGAASTDQPAGDVVPTEGGETSKQVQNKDSKQEAYKLGMQLVQQVYDSLKPLEALLSACLSHAQLTSPDTQDAELDGEAAVEQPMNDGNDVAQQERDALALNPGATMLTPGASQLLPMVELIFAVTNQIEAGELAALGSKDETEPPAASETPRRSLLPFIEKHRAVLNSFIRSDPRLLHSAFKPMLEQPRMLDFDNKRTYFHSKLKSQERLSGTLRINVRREHVFEDSYHQLRSRQLEELRCKLSITFSGEEGIDAGGLTREWYQLMVREMFNPNLALFVSIPEGANTFQPNPLSTVHNDRGIVHLDLFRFCGRVVGKCVYDRQVVDAHFTRSFYKHLLKQPLSYEDLEAVDPDYYKSLKFLLDHRLEDIGMELTFTYDRDYFGRTEQMELKPGGREIAVTDENKFEYVNLITMQRMTTAIKAQLNAFQEGFWDMVPYSVMNIFNDHELELLIAGLPDINVADLKANTEYQGYTELSPQVLWFWEVVSAMSKQELALLMQFVTGTSKVPLDGFGALQGISGPQKFSIHKAYGSTDRLPSAHTCFNQIDMPEYESLEVLEKRLKVSIYEGSEGFGFG